MREDKDTIVLGEVFQDEGYGRKRTTVEVHVPDQITHMLGEHGLTDDEVGEVIHTLLTDLARAGKHEKVKRQTMDVVIMWGAIQLICTRAVTLFKTEDEHAQAMMELSRVITKSVLDSIGTIETESVQ